MTKLELGRSGELIAADYLKAKGYTVVEVNWRCTTPKGELDIIARQDDVIVFVEVRTRHSLTTESAFESISPRKQEFLARAAQLFLQTRGFEQSAWRIDVIAIAVPRDGKPIIDHVENALDW